MTRLAYLASLWVLEAALVWYALPPLAQALQRSIPLGATVGGASGIDIACAMLAVIGITMSLGYPALACMRHVQRGRQRFDGLAGWSVAMTIAGSALFVVAHAALLLAASTALEWVAATSLRPLTVAGLAAMAGGSLAAELLRRSVPITAARRPRPVDAGPPIFEERFVREPYLTQFPQS